MIELVSHKLCINCNLCVQVCPTNVFDAVPDQPPAIARKEDCQVASLQFKIKNSKFKIKDN